MRRSSLTGLFLCILAIWMQVLAPVAAMAMDGAAADPFSVICANPSADGAGGSQPAAPAHDHHHCLLCHAQAGATLFDGHPAFTGFDYPVASPLRWRLADRTPTPRRLHRIGQPRGPPALV